jgi:hypothetical protein
VKNHDFTPKIIFFPIAEGGTKMFGVFRVKNHDFTPKKSYFFPILGGARAGCARPPGSAPAELEFIYNNDYSFHVIL